MQRTNIIGAKWSISYLKSHQGACEWGFRMLPT